MKVEKIIEIVCKDFDVSIDTVQLPTKIKEVIEPRQISQYFAKELCPDLTLDHIGMEIGNQECPHVLHSCKVVKDRFETDKNYRERIIRIEQRLMIEAMRGVLPKYTMNTYQERKQLILN